MLVRLAAVVLLLASGTVAAEDPPDLTGGWRLNPGLSDDIEEKIKLAAGSQSMSGGPSWAAETWFPWGGGFSEGKRVGLREFLLEMKSYFEALEIEQSATEVRTIHGEDGVRNFNLTRASSGTSALGGETVTRQAHWQAQQLVLETKGKESKLVELITLVPSRNQLTYAIRFEHKLLKAPLEMSLLYDKLAAR